MVESSDIEEAKAGVGERAGRLGAGRGNCQEAEGGLWGCIIFYTGCLNHHGTVMRQGRRTKTGFSCPPSRFSQTDLLRSA